jgi:hypothetical protein
VAHYACGAAMDRRRTRSVPPPDGMSRNRRAEAATTAFTQC